MIGELLPWIFYSRHVKYAHPGILAFLARSELKSCKWHFSDPGLIAKALQCKKILNPKVFQLFAQRGSTMVPRDHRELTLSKGDSAIGKLIAEGVICKDMYYPLADARVAASGFSGWHP